jgi:hypothetical protein
LPPPSDSLEDAINKKKNCDKALKVAGGDQAGIDRTNGSMGVISAAALQNNIDPALLAAVGIRESDFLNRNENDGAGVGVGRYQLTVTGGNSGPTVAQAGDLAWSSNDAASRLASNRNSLASRFRNFTPAQVLQATAAAYNLGKGGISGNPATIDYGTAPAKKGDGHPERGNYGSNVVQLMDCF